MKPAPPLRNRVFREFKAAAMTLHHVERAVTLQDTRRPTDNLKVALGGEGAQQLYWETVRPMKLVARTTLEYIAALRLLTGTYAYCGTHPAESKIRPGHMVVFFLWEVALNYVDEVTEMVIKLEVPETSKVSWLRARD